MMVVENNCETRKFNRSLAGSYFQDLIRMLSTPGKFFEDLPENVHFGAPLGFLAVSALFFAGASLTCISDNRLVMGTVLFSNAVVMPFITAGISYLVVTMTMGKRVTFVRLFTVFSYAAGVTLLVSWIPLFVWLTEPWKWILTGIGMVKACSLGWIQSALVMTVTVFTVMLLFWSLAPVVAFIKGVPG